MTDTPTPTVFVFGSNLTGYTPADIAPMFRLIPNNVFLPEAFK